MQYRNAKSLSILDYEYADKPLFVDSIVMQAHKEGGHRFIDVEIRASSDMVAVFVTVPVKSRLSLLGGQRKQRFAIIDDIYFWV